MNTLDAARLAGVLCAAFPCKPETAGAYALAVEGYDAIVMEIAVKECMATYERLPTVRQLIAAYRKAEAESKLPAACETRDPPCGYCADAGIFKESIAPFTGRQRYRDDDDNDLGPVWEHKPACSQHSKEHPMSRPTKPHWAGDRVNAAGYGPS